MATAKRAVAAFSLLVSLTIQHGVLQGAAELDSGFGEGGKVTTDVSGRYEEIRALIIEPDGQVVAAGVAGLGIDQDFALARYNEDGSLDATFGTGGKVTLDVSGGSDSAWALALQRDGKLLTAGVANGDFAVVRYNSDGSVDTRFGVGGKVLTDFGGEDRANAIAVQPDGRIVVAGVANALDFGIVRYTVDGQPDATFGPGGTIVTDFSGNTDAAFTAAIQADGMIVVAGATGTFPTAQFALARYNDNGSLDTTFGSGGTVTMSFGRDARAHALAIQPDGKIVMGGFVNHGSSNDGALARNHSDGTVDSSFGDAGRVVTDFGGRNFGAALAIQADGRVVVAGSDDFPPYYDFAIARYEGDGTQDLSFNTNGTVLTEFGANSWINALAIQPDGKVLAGGYARTSSGGDFALVRYAVTR